MPISRVAGDALRRVLTSVVEGSVTQRVWSTLKRLPLVQTAARSETWGRIRHRVALHADERRNITFTQFLRLPRQYDALAGPVLDALLPPTGDLELSIVVIGCSNGAEPYSIASILSTRRPGLRFVVRAFDNSEEMLAQARRGEYVAEEIYRNAHLPAEFVAATFQRGVDTFRVRPEVARHVTFAHADVLDQALAECTGTADILYVQNLLYNLPRAIAARAFANTLALLRSRSAMFLDGMDLDMRTTLTRRAGLVPLDALIAEIHEDARVVRGGAWPWSYWGLERFSAERWDWQRRYATIFLTKP